MAVIIAAVVIILVIVLLFLRRATRAGEPTESVEGRDVPDDAESLR
jgi:uncharacterized membrane protein